MTAADAPESPARWRALALIAGAELAAMSLWFSGAAVAPSLAAEWSLTAPQAAWLTLAVQLGFVAGTLVSAFGNLPDLLSPRRLFATSAVLAAVANAALAVFAGGLTAAVTFRFLVGFFLAGVYPPGMKILASWFRRGRGLALGVLVGGISAGKGFPYLVNAIGSPNWRVNVVAVSTLAIAGGALALFFVHDGPHAPPAARFDAAQIAKVFRNRGVRLADFGYFGHMWELYAMWTWFPVFVRASFAERGLARPELAEVASFLVIGAGAVGCVVAGLAADRVGRTAVTSWAMAISGTCCLTIGFFYGGNPRSAARRRRDLGGHDRRRLRAVLGVRHGALRPALRRDGADHPDLHRLPDHDGLDRARPAARRPRGLALGVRGPRRGARAWDPRHAASAPPPRGGADRARPALTPR